MQRIAIFAALQWECRPVLRHLRCVTRERHAQTTLWHGTAGGCEVWLVKTGIGLQRAALAARTVCEPRFDLVMSTGCAGALVPEMVPGDLAVASVIVGSGEHFETDLTQRERVRNAGARTALRLTAGPVLCSPRVLTTVAEKRAAAAHGAIAVEMEGSALAASAARTRIPFVSVRAILDTADTELPHLGKITEPQNGTLKPFGRASYLATHPGALPALLAMQQMRRAAEASLETFFGAWFER